MIHSGIVGVDLTNGDLWEVESFTSKALPGTGPDSYFPIKDFELPVFQRSRVMGAAFENPVGRPYWRRGCYLKQCVVGVGGIDPGNLIDLHTWHVPMFHPLIFFPDPAPIVWRLRVSVPSHHKMANVTIYRFTGEIDLPLSTQLKGLDAKLDQLLSQP